MVLRVKVERIARDIRSYQFAALVGCNPQLWSRYERGTQAPPTEVAERASELLGKPSEELFAPVVVESPGMPN